MLNPLDINKRKHEVERAISPQNLSMAERSARKGSISKMEECFKYWNSFLCSLGIRLFSSINDILSFT